MPKISVLMAAYNAEKYIAKALGSLAMQTLADIEVVCIDDASTDSTADIIADFAAKDSRFKLLRQEENQGQAVARNAGLALCTSPVICFLDADDWLSADALEIVCNAFDANKSAGCVLFRCVFVHEDGREEDYGGLDFTVLSGREAFEESLNWHVHGIYAARRELYFQYPYDASCRVYSDDNTTRLHYLASTEVVQSEARYYYYQHSGSVTHKVSVNRLLRLAAADSMKRQLREHGVEERIMRLWESERWKVLVDCYYFYHKHRDLLAEDERRHCLDTIRKGLANTDVSRVSRRLSRKLGYMPCRKRWQLFRLQEELYFFLKRCAGRY